MRVLICGSRTWNDPAPIEAVISQLRPGTVVIEGDAPGADRIAGQLARRHGLEVLTYPADWARYGDAAGPIRNARMLREGKPTHVVAFRMPGTSRGTDNMIDQARKAGVPVSIIGPDFKAN